MARTRADRERITIFRTQDPYDRRDFQFIVSRELTLETYDSIGSKALCELGLGERGEKFWVRCVVSDGKKNPFNYLLL
jgi:hypothetical protein